MHIYTCVLIHSFIHSGFHPTWMHFVTDVLYLISLSLYYWQLLPNLSPMQALPRSLQLDLHKPDPQPQSRHIAAHCRGPPLRDPHRGIRPLGDLVSVGSCRRSRPVITVTADRRRRCQQCQQQQQWGFLPIHRDGRRKRKRGGQRGHPPSCGYFAGGGTSEDDVASLGSGLAGPGSAHLGPSACHVEVRTHACLSVVSFTFVFLPPFVSMSAFVTYHPLCHPTGSSARLRWSPSDGRRRNGTSSGSPPRRSSLWMRCPPPSVSRRHPIAYRHPGLIKVHPGMRQASTPASTAAALRADPRRRCSNAPLCSQS